MTSLTLGSNHIILYSYLYVAIVHENVTVLPSWPWGEWRQTLRPYQLDVMFLGHNLRQNVTEGGWQKLRILIMLKSSYHRSTTQQYSAKTQGQNIIYTAARYTVHAHLHAVDCRGR